MSLIPGYPARRDSMGSRPTTYVEQTIALGDSGQFENTFPIAVLAPVAAAGDMITAVVAIGVVALFRGGRAPTQGLITAWNGFGMLDLIVAVCLALLAVPGMPFQVFTDIPARSAFTELPWIAVPGAIVPFLFFNHLAIFLKLRAGRDRSPRWSGQEARA
jgi:hypothetical protein